MVLTKDEDEAWEPSNRRERLLELVRSLAGKQKIKILFVCGGNKCRSPYAEMMFEKMLAGNEKLNSCKEITVLSGGFSTNTCIHEFTRKALLEAGITEERVERFKPRVLRKSEKRHLEEADLVIAPTRSIIEVLVPRRFRDKAFLFSEISGPVQEDIPDPILMEDYAEYRGVLEKINPHLEALVGLLEREAC